MPTVAVVIPRPMSLRGAKPKPKEGKWAYTYRPSDETAARIKAVAQEHDLEIKEVIDNALDTDFRLGDELGDDRERLERFAETHGLSLYQDLPKVLALVVRIGLAAWESEGKKRR